MVRESTTSHASVVLLTRCLFVLEGLEFNEEVSTCRVLYSVNPQEGAAWSGVGVKMHVW